MKSSPETLIDYLHKIIHNNYEVKFSGDFSGMITIDYFEEFAEGSGYIRHEHLNYPDGSMEELTKVIIKSLARFSNEIDEGKVQKD